MNPINSIGLSVEVGELKEFLSTCDLWGEYTMRSDGETSPHKQMTDIWARYKDPSENLKTGDWSDFFIEHDSEWLKDIPSVKRICSEIMEHVNGSRLGGVLITKLPAGAEITPHVDGGWHATYYDKYLVPILNEDGAVFCYNGVNQHTPNGDVYAFRNDKQHWVKNESVNDRIVMIVCIKQNKFSKEGLCLGDTQQQQ